MGLIRLLLAISVVLHHSNSIFGIFFIDGEYAVQAFYIISGFYMSLILNEKYYNKPYKLFITNRIMRIYPIYFVVLLITFIVSLSAGLLINNYGFIRLYINYFSNMNIFNLMFLAFVNLFIIGQDLLMFLGLNTASGNFYLTSNFQETNPQVYNFLLVPQSWTLALEMYFYIIAPFIVRKKTIYLIILMSISLALRLWFYRLGLSSDPWSYRFFPFELFLFISGCLCYKIYAKIKLMDVPVIINIAILLFVVCIIIFYTFLPKSFPMVIILLYVSFCAFLPFIFNFTKYNKTDRMIGELSYPVYIVHILIAGMLSKIIPLKYLGFASVFGSIVLSLILIRVIFEPIERYRQNRLIS